MCRGKQEVRDISVTTKVIRVGNKVDRAIAPAAVYRTRFECPICGYEGPFATEWSLMGRRPHAMCPRCRSMERHRTQALVMDQLAERYDFGSLRILHMAPEAFFEERFRREFGEYVSADLGGVERGRDLDVDLTDTDLEDDSFDVVYASHVLEHIKDDRAAAETIARVLRPNGFAVLPVPIVVEHTVEFPERVETEFGHVRAPGPDYTDRFADLFEIELFTSAELDQRKQVWVYENRSRYPTKFAPYRTPTQGKRHVDIVPVLRLKA